MNPRIFPRRLGKESLTNDYESHRDDVRQQVATHGLLVLAIAFAKEANQRVQLVLAKALWTVHHTQAPAGTCPVPLPRPPVLLTWCGPLSDLSRSLLVGTGENPALSSPGDRAVSFKTLLACSLFPLPRSISHDTLGLHSSLGICPLHARPVITRHSQRPLSATLPGRPWQQRRDMPRQRTGWPQRYRL